MTDTLTPSQRHTVMSHIRGKDTKPELLVRRWLWHHGYRYRLNVKGVPGKPDIVMRKYRTAIFVNGCFWHGHEGCGKFRMPQSNVAFWKSKITRNRERDRKNYQLLQDNGWQVLVVWECQLHPKLLENTMLQVEVQLQNYFLQTFGPKSVKYIHLPAEDDTPMAAESAEEYETTSNSKGQCR